MHMYFYLYFTQHTIFCFLFLEMVVQHGQIQNACSQVELLSSTELFHIAAVVVCIVGGQRLTKGQDKSKPPALAAWGNVGKRARE